MSVLIKGMKMPKSCIKCSFCGLAGIHMERLVCMFTGKSEVRELIDDRLPGCPVVALPEKHGRLIDADELVRIWTGAKFYGNIKPIVDARPTVIEAEGET